MSTIQEIHAEPGLSINLYCGQGSQWLTTAGVLEAYNAGHTYAAAGIEVGSTGLYTAATGTPPAMGWYWVFWMVGTDFVQKFGRALLYWDGTNWGAAPTTSAVELTQENIDDIAAGIVAAIGEVDVVLDQTDLTSIADAVAGHASVVAIKGTTDKLGAMIETSGGDQVFTAVALAAAPTGGGSLEPLQITISGDNIIIDNP